MAYEPELERLERRYQDDPARNFAQLAEAYRKANRLDDALTLLQGHLTERPNYVSGLVVLGRCLLDQHNDAEARDTFERVLGVDSEHIIALRALGEIAERAGERDRARQWFTRLLDVDPMNEDAEQALARIDAGGADVASPAAPPEAPAAAEPPPVAEPAPSETPATFPAPAVDEPSWSARTAEFAGEASTDSPEAGATAQPLASEPQLDPEFMVEADDERFMPRASGAHPRDVETIGELEIQSRLDDEESPIGAVPDTEEEPYQFPTGEREVDLGAGDVHDATSQLADEGPGRAPGSEGELGITAFDDSLGWGAGERTSRQISREDLDEIERTHEDTVAPVSELPGLEQTEVPSGDATAEVGRVEGLQEFAPGAVEPLEGFEATAAGDVRADEPAEEPVAFIEQEPERVEAAPQEAVPAATAPPGDARDASGKAGDPGTAERRASLMGLPLLEGAESAESDEPLVLDAEPEPVVTETMAELYVRQGLLDEAREVYQRLLAQRPGDVRLAARLAELSGAGRPARPAVQYDAAKSGGQSARGLMMAVLAARPGEAADQADAAVPVVAAAPAVPTDAAEAAPGEEAAGVADEPAAAPAPEAPAAAPAPEAPAAAPAPEASEPAQDAEASVAPMDQAFSEEHGDAALGAPTQPASDEVTLAAIFGEAPALAPAPKPEAPRPTEPKAATGGRAPGGFSFDEFFAKPAGSAPEGGDRPQRDSMSDDEGEEAFRDWLKGLKG